ncbi:hypothetical protein GCM10010300_77670 [Streptomyces olivaceoviridis]|nr:hypothetical protein GCM10010300_77670 [Streptomyces olivaceoviridis]
MTGPRVLFADEPTGALDSLNGERVMEMLTDAARSTNAAVVLVTHEARVAAYSDREVVVRDGRSRDMERVVRGGGPRIWAWGPGSRSRADVGAGSGCCSRAWGSGSGWRCCS